MTVGPVDKGRYAYISSTAVLSDLPLHDLKMECASAGVAALMIPQEENRPADARLTVSSDRELNRSFRATSRDHRTTRHSSTTLPLT